jgi:hypothetical protein
MSVKSTHVNYFRMLYVQVYLCRSDIVREKLVEKDAKLGSLLINSAIRSNAPAPSLRFPLLSPTNRFDEQEEKRDDYMSQETSQQHTQSSGKNSFSLGGDIEAAKGEDTQSPMYSISPPVGSNPMGSPIVGSGMGGSYLDSIMEESPVEDIVQPHASTLSGYAGRPTEAGAGAGVTAKKHSSSFSGTAAAIARRKNQHSSSFSGYESGFEPRVTEANLEILDTIDDAAFAVLSQDTKRIIEDSRTLLKGSPKLLQYAMRSEHCRQVMEPYRWALFINIFASILQGSFISYASGCILDGVELPTVLYFVRIFADLIGRPLALLPKPYYFSSIDGVLVAAVVRGLSTTFYFSVIANVMYPQHYTMSTLCHVVVLIFQVRNDATEK